MIRHLAELFALFLCFAVGVGLLAAFVIGLLMIWRPEFTTTAREKEYRRVESAGRMLLPDIWMGFPVESHPYDWATDEPMVWAVLDA